jgi:hypothetical protein
MQPPEQADWPNAIKIERAVPASANMAVGPQQQFWLGSGRTGQRVTSWIDTTTVHLSTEGWRIETVPSRLSAIDIGRLGNLPWAGNRSTVTLCNFGEIPRA